MNDPYNEGYADYEDDRSKDANPYYPGGEAWADWRTGWDDAQNDENCNDCSGDE